MELKPGYKQTEVGIIPKDWQIANGLEITSLISKGSSPKWQGFNYSESGMLFVTSENVREGFLDVSKPKYLPLEFHEKLSRTKLQRGDILINLVEASIGRSCCITTDISAANVNQAVAVFRVDDKFCPQFFAYYLQAPSAIKRIFDMQVDVARPNISLTNLREFLFCYPPLPEQRAIAAALSDTDALLSSLDRLIAKKRDIKQAVMQQLLTGKQRLPGYGGEWEVKRLGEVSRIGMGRTPSRRMQAFWGQGYPWLSIADLKTKYISETKEEITSLAASTMTVIPKGTLIMSFKLSIGRMAFTARDMYSNEAICSFGDLKMNANFLYYKLGQTDFSLYGKQAVKGFTLNSESLNIIEVAYPPLDEQTAIAAVLSDMDAEIDALQQRRDKTRAVKQGMMQELLTGRTRLV